METSNQICVFDFVLDPQVLVLYFDKELQGYVKFHGPVDHADKGFKELYGVELPEGEGSSNGEYKDCKIKNKAQERKYFTTQTQKSGVFVKKRNVVSILKPVNGKRLTLHDKVRVIGRSSGVIKFIGPTLFGPHIWYGIELDTKLGRNDGMVRGIRYFESKPMHGVFVREEKLQPLDKHGNPINKLREVKKKSREERALDLFDACAKGDIKSVRSILMVDKTAARDARDPDSEATALMTASYHGYHNIVMELVNTRKIDVNEKSNKGMTALHYAAQAGHEKVVSTLLKHSINVDTRTDDGTTALYLAVEKGHSKVVKQLLDAFADANLSSRDGESPLIQACHRGYHKIVEMIMKAPNVKINQKRSTDGATALFVACREGSQECVKYLLSNPMIKINESKTNCRSPLFIASFFGHTKIVEMLLNHSKNMRSKNMEHGIIDVNQADSKGFTPLFVAAQNGHDEIVKLLLLNRVWFFIFYIARLVVVVVDEQNEQNEQTRKSAISQEQQNNKTSTFICCFRCFCCFCCLFTFIFYFFVLKFDYRLM